MSYSFRLAETGEDLLQIRRLNHRIFAAELGQHGVRTDGLLEDHFEGRSRFLLALHHNELAGMVCVHDSPPWSVAKRLADPAILEELPRPLLEVRLLALAPEHRRKAVLAGLLAGMLEHALDRGGRTLIISGVTAQADMYRRIGFRELGPAVAEGRAEFYPMTLDLHALPATVRRSWQRYRRRDPAVVPPGGPGLGTGR